MKMLKSGLKLKSAVCDTELMVIRAAPDAVDIRCGGVPMLLAGENGGGELDDRFASGTLVGKRYVDSGERYELLCTRGGKGSLSIIEEPLNVKIAKALPSSD